MTCLSQLLQGEWVPEKEGYRLSRTLEASLYQHQWWSLYGRERVQALSSVVKLLYAAMEGTLNTLNSNSASFWSALDSHRSKLPLRLIPIITPIGGCWF